MINVKLYYVDTNKYTLDEMEKSIFITEKDIIDAHKYKMEINKKEHLASSYFKNKYVNDDIFINEHSKPIAKNVYFNISHSYGYVIFGIVDGYDIGVDIEKIRDVKDDLIKYISNDEELKYIEDNKSFYEIWTSKESIVKCKGIGLIDKVNNIPGLPINGSKEYYKDIYYSKNISSDEWVISITLKCNMDFVIEFIDDFRI